MTPFKLVGRDLVVAPSWTYRNDTYTVTRYVPEDVAGWPCKVVHLSFSRRDRGTACDWREKQQIKNALCGSECEAIELYPAESRKVDAADQFHLWVLADNTVRFPCGFQTRFVSETTFEGSTQRPGSGATEDDERKVADATAAHVQQRDGGAASRDVFGAPVIR